MPSIVIVFNFGFCCSFSTVFSSVHGERPSAEYAKLRKQSLESEFGHALNYSSKRISMFYNFGPFLALYRAAIISFHVLKLAIWQFFVHDTKKRSVMVIYLCKIKLEFHSYVYTHTHSFVFCIIVFSLMK